MEVDLDPTRKPVYREKVDGPSIRLLQFSPCQNGGLVGRLKRFTLADAPLFYSASYTWGSGVYSDTTITLDTGELPVLNCLLPFLQMVGQHENFHDDDWWWIDSVCINLEDGREREQQVQIMADIYRRASKVIVWLGEEIEGENDCTGAVHFLHFLQHLQPVFSGKDAGYVRANLRSPESTLQWEAVGNLLTRSWWTRVWTLQEFILARDVSLYCGDSSITRGKFKAAMYSIFLCSVGDRDTDVDLIPRHAFDTAFNRRRIHQWHVHPRACGIAMVAVLAYLGNHSATDSRDRIYSVLGIITARDRKLIGKPEYTTPVQHQFARLVNSFYNEYRNLDIICFSHLFNRYSATQDPGIEAEVPSWVPDWRVYTEFASPVPLMASQSASDCIGNFRPIHSQKWNVKYDAPGQRLRIRANVRFDQDMKRLWCDGVIVDTIQRLGSLEGCDPRCRSFVCARDDPPHGLIQGAISSGTEAWEHSSPVSLLLQIVRSLVLGRQDTYLRFDMPPHYASDFLVLCNTCLESESLLEAQGSASHSKFASWFRENRDLLIGTRTLGDLVKEIVNSDPLLSSLPAPSIQAGSLSQSLPVYPPNTNVDANADYADNFLSRFLDSTRKKSRRLMVTNEGLVGMAPCRARPGDAVVVLFACSVPLALRRVGARQEWQVVGEVYLDGQMNGEVERFLERGTRTVHRFKLV